MAMAIPLILHLSSGVAKAEDKLITLLNPETLIRQTDEVVRLVGEKHIDDAGIDSSPNQRLNCSE